MVTASHDAADVARIGVVAIGRNEGDRLVRCLASIAPLGLPVVYVDSGSTDGSQATALARGAHVVVLDLLRPFTAARARNEGVEALLRIAPEIAYIQFVDGDCELVAGWIEAASTYLDVHRGVAAACGRRRERFPRASGYNRLCDAEWDTPVGEAAACGGDALVRVTAFNAAGGFNAAMIAGEEPELCARWRAKGWTIWRLDREMTLHDAAMTTLRQWWWRAVRSGFGYAQVWTTTRRGPFPLYRRELFRTAGWTTVPILLAVAMALAIGAPWLLAAPAIYGAQVVRVAVRDEATGPFAWRRAGLLMLTKFAEMQGVLRFARRTIAGRNGGTILYK